MLDYLLYFSPIIIATLGAIFIPKILRKKRNRLLVTVAISIFGLIPIFLTSAGIISLTSNGEFLILMLVLLPLAILTPYLLIEERIFLQPKFPLVFIVAVCSIVCLFFCGFLCAFGGRAIFPENFSILRPVGFFIEGAVFASAGYGMILVFQVLFTLLKERTNNRIAQWHLGVLAGSIVISVLGMLSLFTGTIYHISPSNIPLLWIILSGLGIVLFCSVTSVPDRTVQVSTLPLFALVFLVLVGVQPGLSALFVLGGGTLLILAEGFGMVSGMIIFAEKLHFSLIISGLLISSSIIIFGLHAFGILDLGFTCQTMDNPLFSDPRFFLLLIIVSAGITIGICGILSLIGRTVIHSHGVER